MFLGGFPARMFLLLAGVSLMLRYGSDARRGTAVATARRGAVLRGLEIWAYGMGYRLLAWVAGGLRSDRLTELFKVDILNCMGVSLVVAALVVSPTSMQPSWRRPPVLAGLLALGIALGTPLVQAQPYPSFLPGPLAQYLWDRTPEGTFAQLPFLAYLLGGCCLGWLWLQADAKGLLPRVMFASGVVGSVLIGTVLLLNHRHIALYQPSAALPIPAYPSSYFLRLGYCVAGLAGAYFFCRHRPPPRVPALRYLGQASLLVYFVHLELAYGRAGWPLFHRLPPVAATLAIVILTGLMVLLAWARLTHWPALWQRLRARIQ